MKKNKSEKAGTRRVSFSGKAGYVLSVAGSAVGLGNIWRFPYLTAKYGGGIFLLIYLILMVTFGYALIISETAVGRMTGKSPVGAFTAFGKKPFQLFGGWINAAVPMLVVPYYCVIGGWITKYLYEYIKLNGASLAADGYFARFTEMALTAEMWFIVFSVLVFLVIIAGVKKGVERLSRLTMPLLLVLAVFLAVYSVTRPGAWEGVRFFFVPALENFSVMTVVAAMGQMFYSLSISMGVLYTYGSYINKDIDIEKSTKQVEIFDAAVAVLSGLMIIPAVFAFSGGDPGILNAGPSLMFITIPKVFASMGSGALAGIVFFLLVLVAALTSAVALAETGVSTFCDQLGWSRGKSCALMAAIVLFLGSPSAMGFNLSGIVRLSGMNILDFFDFLTNSIMMPIGAFATCILVTRIAGLDRVIHEVRLSSAFKKEKTYMFLMKYLVPACTLIILISSILSLFGR